LAEIKNKTRWYRDAYDNPILHQQAFALYRFRPLTERTQEQDVALIKSLLNTTEIDASKRLDASVDALCAAFARDAGRGRCL
jgi:hypothetical protein